MAPNRFFTVSGITTGWAIISFAKQNFWPEQKIRAVAEAFARDCTACGELFGIYFILLLLICLA